jgi:hypothetical protein
MDDELLGAGTDELHLLLPPFSTHLRAIRLVAADAAMRAGLDVGEADDLRIAVDELAHALMTNTDHRLHVTMIVEPGRVVVRGSARHRGASDDVQLLGVSATIVNAVCDHYLLETQGDKIVFVVVKHGRRLEGIGGRDRQR